MQQECATAAADAELLTAYARERNDKAFAEIVARYRNMVYSAALRQVRDPGTAEDVTLAVFIILISRAQTQPMRLTCCGWIAPGTGCGSTRRQQRLTPSFGVSA